MLCSAPELCSSEVPTAEHQEGGTKTCCCGLVLYQSCYLLRVITSGCVRVLTRGFLRLRSEEIFLRVCATAIPCLTLSLDEGCFGALKSLYSFV